MKWVRDDEGAWASASTEKRIVGLVLGLALTGLLMLPAVLIVLFLIGRI